MADQTYIPGQRTSAGDALYDSVMSEIDAELTTTQLPLLKEKYANETPDEAKQRAARYEAAFAEYEKRMQKVEGEWQESFVIFKKDALDSVEQMDREEEQNQLSALESSISNA